MYELPPEHIGHLPVRIGLEAIHLAASPRSGDRRLHLVLPHIVMAGEVMGNVMIGDVISDAIVLTVHRAPC